MSKTLAATPKTADNCALLLDARGCNARARQFSVVMSPVHHVSSQREGFEPPSDKRNQWEGHINVFSLFRCSYVLRVSGVSRSFTLVRNVEVCQGRGVRSARFPNGTCFSSDQGSGDPRVSAVFSRIAGPVWSTTFNGAWQLLVFSAPRLLRRAATLWNPTSCVPTGQRPQNFRIFFLKAATQELLDR